MAIITSNSENEFVVEYEDIGKKCHISSKSEIFSYLQDLFNIGDIDVGLSLCNGEQEIKDLEFFERIENFHKNNRYFRIQDNQLFDKDIQLELRVYVYGIDDNGEKKYLDTDYDFTSNFFSHLPQNADMLNNYSYGIYIINSREEIWHQVGELNFQFARNSGIIFSGPRYVSMTGKAMFDIGDFIEEIVRAFSPKNNETITWN